MSLVWIGGYYRSQREAFHISTRANIARGLFQIIDIIPVDLGSFLQVDGLILSRLLTSAHRCPVHVRWLIRLRRLDNPVWIKTPLAFRPTNQFLETVRPFYQEPSRLVISAQNMGTSVQRAPRVLLI